jgi:hypothetical protein
MQTTAREATVAAGAEIRKVHARILAGFLLSGWFSGQGSFFDECLNLVCAGNNSFCKSLKNKLFIGMIALERK